MRPASPSPPGAAAARTPGVAKALPRGVHRRADGLRLRCPCARVLLLRVLHVAPAACGARSSCSLATHARLSFEAALRRFTPGICRPSRRLEPVSRRVRCAEPASYTGGLGSWVGLPAVELLGWGSGWRRGGWPVKATTRGCGSWCAPSPDDRLLSETALLRFPFAPRV